MLIPKLNNKDSTKRDTQTQRKNQTKCTYKIR